MRWLCACAWWCMDSTRFRKAPEILHEENHRYCKVGDKHKKKNKKKKHQQQTDLSVALNIKFEIKKKKHWRFIISLHVLHPECNRDQNPEYCQCTIVLCSAFCLHILLLFARCYYCCIIRVFPWWLIGGTALWIFIFIVPFSKLLQVSVDRPAFEINSNKNIVHSVPDSSVIVNHNNIQSKYHNRLNNIFDRQTETK